MNLIDQLAKEQIAKLTTERGVPDFQAGDTLKVSVKVVEGDRTRVQVYEGLCIARRNESVNSSFTVRKISYGEGVERVFPLYSPNVVKIEVVRRGEVRRAKLYYLRGRTGKSARIIEKTNVREGLVKTSDLPLPEGAEAPVKAKKEKKVKPKKA